MNGEFQYVSVPVEALSSEFPLKTDTYHACIHAAVLGICRSAASLQTFSCETAQLSFDSPFETMNGITASTTLNCSLTLGPTATGTHLEEKHCKHVLSTQRQVCCCQPLKHTHGCEKFLVSFPVAAAEKEQEMWGRRRERDTEEVKMKFSSKIVYVLRINDFGGRGSFPPCFPCLHI